MKNIVLKFIVVVLGFLSILVLTGCSQQPVQTQNADGETLEGAVPIEPGSQTIRVEVQVTWLLEE